MKKTNYLNRNENLYGPASNCFKVLKEVDSDIFISYSPYFTNKITPKLSKLLNIPKEQIILGYGDEDIFRTIFDNFVNKEDVVLVPQFGWRFYDMQIERKKAERDIIKMNKLSNKFEYDIKNLKEKYNSKKPKLIIITSPNMPTGNSISFEDLENFLESIDKNCLVIIDEAYWGFSDKYDDKNVNLLLDKCQNLMFVRTFSKLYALAGLRVGFALCGKEVKQMLNIQDRFLGFNRLSEKIITAVLDSKEYYLDLKKKFIQQRKIITKKINSFTGWKAYQSDGNFILIEFPENNKTKLKRFLENNNVIVRFFDNPEFNNILRLSIGREAENKLFLELITKFINKNI